MRFVQQVRMRKSRAASGLSLLALAFAAGAPAAAASSAWQTGEGASLRLLTAGGADRDGMLRGVIDIALEPGWKTYWRDPGAAGVPPSIDVSASTNVSAAALRFPLPERHDDGYGAWAGYGAPVALPVLFKVADPAKHATVEADVFLGICKDICIPFPAHVMLDTASGDDPEDAAAVDAAFAGLPKPASRRFRVVPVALDGETLVLEAHLPAATAEAPELFVAGENGYAFGVPVAQAGPGGTWRFSVPVLDRPEVKPGDAGIFYTLAGTAGAVSGTFAMP